MLVKDSEPAATLHIHGYAPATSQLPALSPPAAATATDNHLDMNHSASDYHTRVGQKHLHIQACSPAAYSNAQLHRPRTRQCSAQEQLLRLIKQLAQPSSMQELYLRLSAHLFWPSEQAAASSSARPYTLLSPMLSQLIILSPLPSASGSVQQQVLLLLLLYGGLLGAAAGPAAARRLLLGMQGGAHSLCSRHGSQVAATRGPRCAGFPPCQRSH